MTPGSITTWASCLWCASRGTLRKGDKIKVQSTGQVYNADRLGIFTPKQVDRDVLNCGEVGWLVCAIKDILGAPVGDDAGASAGG